MTDREKKLLMVVAVLGLVGVCYACYQMIYMPLQRNKAEQEKLLTELSDKQDQLDKMQRDLKRLPIAKKRSLPADIDVAKREYESALGYMLRSNGVPAGYTITPKVTVDARSIPEIAPKKPAYTRIGYDIRMQKVDLPTVVKVLQAYYDLNLLHQITALDIKRVEKEGSAASTGSSRRNSDRADLEVTFHTEAIILDGAENRRTLKSVPISFAAAGGIGGYHAIMNMPETSRGIKTKHFPSLLAEEVREYLAMEARNVFHGPLPPPPPPPVAPEKKENPFAEAPKEDIAPYIRFNAITTSSTGVKEATIWDTASNNFYELNVRDEDTDAPEFQFLKKYKLGEKWKNYEYNSWKPLDQAQPFVIGEEGTATLRTFQFLGYFEDGLVLKEIVSSEPIAATPKIDPKAPEPKKGARPVFGKERITTAPKLSKDDLAYTGAVGGLAMTKPKVTIKYYVWRLGQTLSTLEGKNAMTEEAARNLLKKSSSSSEVKTPTSLEIAPVARSSN